jgi:hypothetical protein
MERAVLCGKRRRRGSARRGKKYVNRRIGVIYDTNMSTAYAAERYRKRLEGAENTFFK